MKRNLSTPGRFFAPAFLLLASAAVVGLSGTANAQATQPPPSAQPVPGDLELAKLVWTTIAAVDHANQSGNYSVLRDISATAFQINNDAARLAQIFAGLRASRIDLSNTLLLAPTYSAAPSVSSEGIMRVQGYFGLRPTAIAFDLYYQWVQGRWRLDGISITPRTIASLQPEANPPPPPAAPPKPTRPSR